jgi:predicted PurR-regulated permease PerM
MLLSVFSGIAMFGFFGIILGPVLMIVIVTTIAVYLAVYKGVAMESDVMPEKHRKLFKRRRSKIEATPDTSEPAQPPTSTAP